MMKWIIFSLLLFIAVLLESTITTLPLVFIVLLCGAVVFNSTMIFLWSFFIGVIFDALTMKTIGASSVFFLIVLALTFLYERKFEIQSIQFIIIAGFLGSIGYLWIFGYSYVFLEAVICAIVGGGLFFVMQALHNRLKF